MKYILKSGIIALLLSPAVYADDISTVQRARGTAGVDERYLKELPNPQTKIDVSKTREKMIENPRNPAIVEGFQEVDDQKEAQEEKFNELNTEPENVMEDESYGAEYDESVWDK